MIHISNAVLEKVDLESGLHEIFACVADAVLRRDAAYVYVRCVKKPKDFAKGLTSIVHSVKARILFKSLVASLVKCQLFVYIWNQIGVDFTSTGSCNAVRRPYAAVFLE